MLRKLFQASRADGQEWVGFGRDGFVEGEVLPLPLGAIVAEQGVAHLRESSLQRVQPVLDEAYVVMRLYDQSTWYATWQPYAAGWCLLRLEAGLEPAANDADFPVLPAVSTGCA